jgi:hypothetical protein
MTEAVRFSHASLVEASIKDGQDLKNVALVWDIAEDDIWQSSRAAS